MVRSFDIVKITTNNASNLTRFQDLSKIFENGKQVNKSHSKYLKSGKMALFRK